MKARGGEPMVLSLDAGLREPEDGAAHFAAFYLSQLLGFRGRDVLVRTVGL